VAQDPGATAAASKTPGLRTGQNVDAAAALEHLVSVCHDASLGAAIIADSIKDKQLAKKFREIADERTEWASQLVRQLVMLDDSEVPTKGTFKGRRFQWRLKAKASKGDPEALINVAKKGSDWALKQYDKALDAGLPSRAQNIVVRQMKKIRATQEWLASRD
jgi:uncharacterized protein (TIGR02284 family)